MASKKRDTWKAIGMELVEAAIPCLNSMTLKNTSFCHGIRDSTLLVKRAKALLKAERTRKTKEGA